MTRIVVSLCRYGFHTSIDGFVQERARCPSCRRCSQWEQKIQTSRSETWIRRYQGVPWGYRIPPRHPMVLADQTGMLEEIHLQGQPGPDGHSDGPDRLKVLCGGRLTQLPVDSLLKVSDLPADLPRGSEQFSRQERRITASQSLGEVLSLLAHDRVVRILPFEIPIQPGLYHPIDGRAQPPEVLVETVALDRLDLRSRHLLVLYDGEEASGLAIVFLRRLLHVSVEEVVFLYMFEERGTRYGSIDQELGKSRRQCEKAVQFFLNDLRGLIGEAHDHRGQDSDAVVPKLGENLGNGTTTLLVIAGSSALIADPHPVDPHLHDLGDCVATEGPDTGETKDREGLPLFHHTVPELHCPALVEQEVLVHDHNGHFRIDLMITTHSIIDILSAGEQADMTPFEIMGGATKIATVGTTQAGEDHAALADLFSKDPHRVDHSWVSIRHLDFFFSPLNTHSSHNFHPPPP